MISRLVLSSGFKLTRSSGRLAFLQSTKLKKAAVFGVISLATYSYAKQNNKLDLSFLKKYLSLERFIAHCKEGITKSKRTKVLDVSSEDKSEFKAKSRDENKDKFDWIEFLKLLSNEKFYLLSAIFVSE